MGIERHKDAFSKATGGVVNKQNGAQQVEGTNSSPQLISAGRYKCAYSGV